VPTEQALTNRQREEVVRRWLEGESAKKLAENFDTTAATITKVLNKAKAIRVPSIANPSTQTNLPTECADKEQSYRENLRWAIDAAGEFHRTGKRPAICPNNSAWYLFIQATKDPKDFLGKIGQIESKGEDDSDKELRTSTQHSIEEINTFLEELLQEEK
jgi:hypothetical protein